MESALVTVIVPIYNVAVYMDRCVASITAQTHRNLEIILVDDGSTDGSGTKCDDWAQHDARISVIHQPNAGLSMARNAALNAMTGQYVTMVDGDDIIAPDCISTLYNLMNDTGATIAASGWTLFNDGTEPTMDSSAGRVTTFTSSQAIDDVFYQHLLTNSACAKLYRATVFDHVRYPQGLLYEDLAVIYDVLQAAPVVAHTTRSLYYYRQRNGSITASFSRRRTHVLDIMEQLEQRVATEAPQHLPAVRSRLLSAYFNIFLLCPTDGSMDDIVTRCWTGIKRLRHGCLIDRRVRLKNRLGILLSHLGQFPLRLLGR